MAKAKDPFSYLAKYITKQGGELHFGGTLSSVNFSQVKKSNKPTGKIEAVISAQLPWQLFHMNYKRRKR